MSTAVATEGAFSLSHTRTHTYRCYGHALRRLHQRDYLRLARGARLVYRYNLLTTRRVSRAELGRGGCTQNGGGAAGSARHLYRVRSTYDTGEQKGN